MKADSNRCEPNQRRQFTRFLHCLSLGITCGLALSVTDSISAQQQMQAQIDEPQMAQQLVVLPHLNTLVQTNIAFSMSERESMKKTLEKLAVALQEGQGDNSLAEVYDFAEGTIEIQAVGNKHEAQKFDPKGEKTLREWFVTYAPQKTVESWTKTNLHPLAVKDDTLIASVGSIFGSHYEIHFVRGPFESLQIVKIRRVISGC